MTICVIGHGPDKLYEFAMYNSRWNLLKALFKQKLIDMNCHDAWTGMGLGVDTVFAVTVLEMKEEGFDIRLHCAIPCRQFTSKWPVASIAMYDSILERADDIVFLSQDTYRPYLMKIRNMYMIDHSDEVLAVWDGTSDSTYDCIKYAQEKNIPVMRIHSVSYQTEML